MVLFLQWEFSFSFISISSLFLCLCLCQCKWLWNDLDVWLERWFDLKEKDRNETRCCWKKGMIRVGMNRWDRHKNKGMMSGDGEKGRNEMIVIERMIDGMRLRNECLKRGGWRKKGMDGGNDGCCVVLMREWENDYWNEWDWMSCVWDKRCGGVKMDGVMCLTHTERNNARHGWEDEWSESDNWRDCGGRVCVVLIGNGICEGVEGGMWEIEEWRVCLCMSGWNHDCDEKREMWVEQSSTFISIRHIIQKGRVRVRRRMRWIGGDGVNEQKNERNGRFDELSDCVLREWKTCLRWEKAKRQRTLRRFMLCGEGRVPRLREVVLPNPYSVMFSGGGFPLSSCCFGLITELVTPFIINPLTLCLSSEPQQNNSDLGKGIGLCVLVVVLVVECSCSVFWTTVHFEFCSPLCSPSETTSRCLSTTSLWACTPQTSQIKPMWWTFFPLILLCSTSPLSFPTMPWCLPSSLWFPWWWCTWASAVLCLSSVACVCCCCCPCDRFHHERDWQDDRRDPAEGGQGCGAYEWVYPSHPHHQGLCVWERPFIERIDQARKRELDKLLFFSLLKFLDITIMVMVPGLSMFVGFVLSWTGQDRR